MAKAENGNQASILEMIGRPPTEDERNIAQMLRSGNPARRIVAQQAAEIAHDRGNFDPDVFALLRDMNESSSGK